MNKVYRLIWNDRTKAWAVVSENVKACGKRSSQMVGGVRSGSGQKANGIAFLLKTLAASLLLSNITYAAPAGSELPTGGSVAAGQVTINQTANVLNINQNSNRAVVNWNSFNVGSEATVNFNQPNSSSVILNRVVGNNPSQIFGQINANGQVFLSNSNGVYFAPGASVNVGGLVATTHSISDNDFIAGKNTFTRSGANASVINKGEITANLNGYIALLAPEVRNEGLIVAQLGTVALAAGETFDLQIDGNNMLSSLRIEPATIETLVENSYAVRAPNGLIILSSLAIDHLQGSVVNSGRLSANSLVSKGGRIILEADNIQLTSTSTLDATGLSGGGEVLVGGDWQGSGEMHQATKVTMEAGATIDASATENGNGGTVVLWSDISKSNSITAVHGSIIAEGGNNGGDGGEVETSGRLLQVDGARVSTIATQGETGDWLLDPGNITIASSNSGSTPTDGTAVSGDTTISTSTLNTALASNNVILATGSGAYDITVADAITYTGINSSLTLNAGRNINIAANITSTNALDLQFNSPVKLQNNIDLSSGGGNVTFASTLDGFSNLAVNSASGNISLLGNVGSLMPLDLLTLTSTTGSVFLGQTGIPIAITSYGKQSYMGNVTLQGDTTLNSLGQTAATLASTGTLSFAGQAARLQITLVGAAGGSGGGDSSRAGGSSGPAGQVTATVRVEDETLTITQGNNGSGGQHEVAPGDAQGGNGGYGFGYNGGRGGNAGTSGQSGGGGGGGGATVVRFSSGGDLIAGGAGGGGGAESNGGNGGQGTTTASYTGSASGGSGGQNGSDSGGGGGGGGGLLGGNGGGAGEDDRPGAGGAAGKSGASNALLTSIESINTSSSSSFRAVSIQRVAIDSGISFNGSVTGNYDLAVNVGNGGTINTNANIDTGTGSQTYSAPLVLTGNTTFKGTNISAGQVNLASHGLTIDESGTAQFSDVVSGTGSITKQGSGLLELQAANTYSGGTTIKEGIAKVMLDSTPLGAPSVSNGSFGTGQVSVETGGAIDLNGKTLGNALNLAGSGVANNGALFSSSGMPAKVTGAITLTDDATIKADNAPLTIDSTITGAHELDLSGSQPITLEQAVSVSALTSSGPGQLNVNNNITTSNGGQTYNSPTQFANAITLSSDNGDIGGTGQVSAQQLQLALNNGDVNFSHRDNQFADTVSIAGFNGGFANNATIVNSTGLKLGAVKILGDLTTTTGTGNVAGGVTQTGALDIGGSSQFIADTLSPQDFTLTNPANNFTGPVSFTNANGGNSRNIDIVDGVGGLILGDVLATGLLDVKSTGGSITQALGTDITVSGDSHFDASDAGNPANITLDNANNDFVGKVGLVGKDIAIADSVGGLILDDVSSSGTLDVDSTGGSITQAAGSNITAAGDSRFDASEAGNPADITLDNANNDFVGKVGLDGKNVSVVDANELALGTVNTSGNLLLASTGDLDFGLTNVDGDLSVDSGNGNITQSNSISVIGVSTFNAGTGSLALSDPNNLFTGKQTINAAESTVFSSELVLVPPQPAVALNVSRANPAVTPTGGLSTRGFANNFTLISTSISEVNVGSSDNSDNGFISVRNFSNMDIPTGTAFSFTLPEDTFQHADPNETITLEAHTETGASLASWITFEPNIYQFSGFAPENVNDVIIVITAHDSAGNEIDTKVVLRVTRI